MIQTSALYWFSKGMTYPPAEIAKAARYSMLWTFPHFDGAGPNGPDHSSIDATIAQVRGVNPRQRIGLYVGGLAFKSEIDPPALWLTDADLLHRPDGSPLVYHDATGLFSPGDPFTYKLPNLGSAAVQDKLLAGYVQFAQQHHLDGILIDGYDPTAYAAFVANAAGSGGMFGCPTGCIEGAWHQPQLWMDALAKFGERLRWRLEQIGCQFVVNGIHPYDGYNPADPTMAWFGPNRVNQVDRSSGAMMEAIHLAYGDPAVFAGIIATVQGATAKRRNVFMLASPSANLPATLDVQRFLLGMYLLVQQPPYTTFGYHPYVPYRAWDGNDPTGHPSGNPYVHWSDDWDLDYGYPLTGCAIGSPATVAWCEYSRCVVVVNPTTTYQQMGLGGLFRLWHPTTGTLIDTRSVPGHLMNIPPREAWVLWKVAA